MVDVGNDGHVTDVRRVVHEITDLLDGEAVRRLLSAPVLLCAPIFDALVCAEEAFFHILDAWRPLT